MSPLRVPRPKKKSSERIKASPKKRTKSGEDRERSSLRKIRDAGRNNRRKEALRKINVTEIQIKAAPEFSEILKNCGGGLTQALQCLRFSPDLTVQAFLEKYDTIPSRDRDSLPWEAIALSAEVDGTRLLGAAIMAIQNYSANTVKVLALSHHPNVMKARIASAMLVGRDGSRDRDAIDTGLGFLPTSKGATFIINPQQKKDDEDDGDEAIEGDLDHMFPSLSKTQDALVPVRSRMIGTGE
jgi:hypothetical protein